MAFFYPDEKHPISTENLKLLNDFTFSRDQFEDAIDCFTPIDEVRLVLHTSKAELDRFCSIVYSSDFAEAYYNLSGMAKFYGRKAIKNLAFAGNNTALKVFADNFMNFNSNSDASKVQIISDIPLDDCLDTTTNKEV